MEEHMPEKKKQILLSAMKLFASKGYVQTTMQEVASFCKMSKGSVYQYYSSKDELLLNIFMYQSKLLKDRLLMLEREKQPNPRERLISKIGVYIHIWNEHPEFIKMQIRDNTKHTESKELREHMQQMNKFNIETLMESLQDIYGEQFSPYMLDSATLLSSLIFTYMYMKLFDNFPIEMDSLSRYIVTIMDYVAEGMLKHGPEPILNGSMVGFDEEHLKPKQLHPLVLVKQLREAVESMDMDSKEKKSWNKQDVLDSIQVLEEELLQVRPRKVILLGMLSNLKEIAPRTSLYERLCKSIEALSGTAPSTLR
ncbi:TetR/AcrR family transcriptional regulator [Paenibacillus sp. NAIST15-1]|uniref:TetR/AcrR family transcriptional regulator n=1 Tax=Paenibacillus sp. NAIST15-1 TaxID=1605994 RepID=UPI00086E66C1|nr:TetR/AcrR family transcriptional regulator [Paenibacillus sp. NAIST15-1]GAV13530.1 putative HTH-type transcriptional regulator YerO [Paenibacillus sp. NAIST15-1]